MTQIQVVRNVQASQPYPADSLLAANRVDDRCHLLSQTLLVKKCKETFEMRFILWRIKLKAPMRLRAAGVAIK